MERKQALEGIKVIDFSWIAAGPQAMKVLAEHGATVVRVESHTRPELLRLTSCAVKDSEPGINRNAHQASYNTNKYGISLDLTNPQGKEIAKKLIEWADIVCESFSLGTMKRLGLDYEEAKKIKPDIIYYSTTIQGQYGPRATFKGFGLHTTALCGFAELTGFPNKESALKPVKAYIDYVAPWYMVITIIGALERRQRTGKGMYIDQAQLEVGLTFLAPAILDYTVNGRVMKRMGNRDPYAVPHGAYPGQGDDKWVAVAVSTDAEWEAFCEAVGNPEWTKDADFATAVSRKDNEDKLDTLVAEWTVNYTPEQVMTLLQAKGVPVGVVNSPEDLFNDAQLKYREHFIYLDHSVIGRHAYQNEAIRFSKSPQRLRKAAPCLGEDNEYVYREILSMTADQISDLIAQGVITSE